MKFSKSWLSIVNSLWLATIAFGLLAFPVVAVNVVMQHNDLSRTGDNLAETNLTPANVNVTHFGKLFSHSVDGQIYAQPLYVQGLTISSQVHNVIFVCTENDSVYAFDADNSTNASALWQVSLGTPVPTSLFSCGDLNPVVGITATPVIDIGSGTLYVEAKSQTVNAGATNYFHQLHALDLTSGAEKFGGPVTVQATVNGITFNNLHQNERSGLLLLSNIVYLSYSSHCDDTPYNGWMIGYNSTNLSQVAVFNTTPGSVNGEGAIWAGGMAPAVDTNGNIYVMTGNGTFNANTGGTNYGMCFLKLSTTNGLSVADWFAPFNESALSSGDRDLGSGGPILLPGSTLLTGMGKNGTNYLLNQNNLGHFSTGNGDTNIVQEFLATLPDDRIGQSPVYWNGPTNQYIYMSTENTDTLAYVFTGSNIQTSPVGVGSTKQTSTTGGISLSANGNTNGILWVIDANNSGTLRAYDAANMPTELWDSQLDSARDALGSFVKFCSPTVANGKVYAPSANALVVYGLLSSSSGGTLQWTGGGADQNWSTVLNWTNQIFGGNGPPNIQDLLLFTNAAATASETVNNIVNSNFTIISLQYANNAANTSPNYQTTSIANGETLTMTNGLIVGTEADAGANNVVNAAVTGAGGTLSVSGGNFSVQQGSGSDGSHLATLDLSGLGTFDAMVSKFGAGVYQLPNGSPRAAGILYLAQTNFITTTSLGVTNGVLINNNSNSGGSGTAANMPTLLYLGQTNVFHTDCVTIGAVKSWAGALLAFNPNGLNSPVAFFRGVNGDTSRVSIWAIGTDFPLNNSNQNAAGTNDFSGGTVDALIGNMIVGETSTGNSGGGISGSGTGILTFNAGTIDVNYLTNGWSQGTGTVTNNGVGIINVNGGKLKVNNNFVIAINTGAGFNGQAGTLNIRNGGQVLANSIVIGGGTNSITMNNGTLILTNTAASPSSRVGTFALTNSVLHLNLNGSSISTNICVTNLIASGVNTIAIDSAVNFTSAKTFPLIAYNSFTGSVAANFVKGTLPNGFVANLVDNSAQHRIDLSIAADTNATPHFATMNALGTNFIFTGTNGLPNGIYYVLASTNVALPLNLWTPVSTNPFDGSGNFNFTNGMNTNAQLFYLLQLP